MAKRRTAKVSVKGAASVDVYKVVDRAVEVGVAYGIRKAMKYGEVDMSEDQAAALEARVADAVMNELCEWLIFDGVRVEQG